MTDGQNTKILLISDLHYTLRQLDWVASAADSCDIVVFAGDLLDISSMVPPDVQIVTLTAFLQKLQDNVRVVLCSGNHDLDGRDEAGEKGSLWVRRLGDLGIGTDGDSIEVGGTLITVCPWWDGVEGNAAVAAQLARDAKRSKQSWLWVYHWPPDQSRVCWTRRGHYGDADLRRWILEHKPDLVLTGHVHDSPFNREGSWADRVASTWVFNAGRQIGPQPCHISIDLGRRTASWTSLAGTESVSLDGPPPPALRAV